MRIIAPTKITPENGRLISSTVPETDYPEWGVATAYTEGQKVIVTASHRCYEALQASTGKAPASSPLDWLDLGPTNRWRMFDDKVGTKTTALGEIKVVLRPGIVSAVALINITGATSARVRVIDDIEGVVYDKTTSLYDASLINDWWTYFFEDVRLKASSLSLDLPVEFYLDMLDTAAELFLDLSSYQSASVEITLSGGESQEIGIGACVIGRLHDYGKSVTSGASVGIQDYSRKERDEFGNFEIVERAFAQRANWNMIIPSADVDRVQKLLASLRATPAVYVGSDDYDSLIVYGFYRDFDITIPGPTVSECSISLEGLV